MPPAIGNEADLTLTAEVFELSLDGSRTLVAGTSLAESFLVSIGEEWNPDGGGYQWLVPNEAKGLYVIEFKLYLGDPADDQLLTHLDMVFCPPELN